MCNAIGVLALQISFIVLEPNRGAILGNLGC